MHLHYTDYNIGSNNPLVKTCLELKVQHVKNTVGIGPHSCCAVMEFKLGNETHLYFGNSQLKNPIIDGIYTHDYMKCHGEASAVMSVLDILGDKSNIASSVKRVYIEMSPCATRCAALLNNINNDLIVYYSFAHPNEVDAWKSAATKLCK